MNFSTFLFVFDSRANDFGRLSKKDVVVGKLSTLLADRRTGSDAEVVEKRFENQIGFSTGLARIVRGRERAWSGRERFLNTPHAQGPRDVSA